MKCFVASPRCWWEMCDFVRRTFRYRCVRSLQGLWYGWVALHLTSLPAQQCLFFTVPTSNHFPPKNRRRMSVFVLHTGARNSRNRFRVSSTGEELSKYTADDRRSARAVRKLGVVGPEVDGSCSSSPTTGEKSLESALRACSAVVQAPASSQRNFFTTPSAAL